MNVRLILAGTLASLLVSCGGGSNTSFIVNGNIRGRTFQAADAISANATIRLSDGSTVNVGVIGISSNGGVCGRLSAGNEAKNAQYLLFFLTDINQGTAQTSPPTAAGSYTVYTGSGQSPAKLAIVQYQQTDASCKSIDSLTADGVSGTVTLTSASNGNYKGTFDLTLSSGDHITGSFSASNCSALSPFISQERTTTCI